MDGWELREDGSQSLHLLGLDVQLGQHVGGKSRVRRHELALNAGVLAVEHIEPGAVLLAGVDLQQAAWETI